jgi:hypothetical protein
MAINNFNVGVGTTSQLTRYRYVATGGETSISGTDADGKTLSYTVGLEQVFLNGVNLVRGQDYTATNGTSVGSLTALVASDVVEVFAYVPFNIANALTVSTVDAKGDLLVGTADNTVGRLAVGTNGQLLSAASGETSGLKWANPGMTLIKTQSFTTVSSVSVDNAFNSNYTNYYIEISGTSGFNANLDFRLRASGTDLTSSSYYWSIFGNASDDATVGTAASNGGTSFRIDEIATRTFGQQIWLFNPFATQYKLMNTRNFRQRSTGDTKHSASGGAINVNTSYDGFTILASQTFSGTTSIYGFNA